MELSNSLFLPIQTETASAPLRNNKWLLSGLLPPEWWPGPIGTVRRSVSLGECGLVCTSGRAYTCCHYFSYLASPCTVQPLPGSPPGAIGWPFPPILSSLAYSTPEIATTRANKLHSLNSTREPAPRKIKRFLWQVARFIVKESMKRVSYISMYNA